VSFVDNLIFSVTVQKLCSHLTKLSLITQCLVFLWTTVYVVLRL